MSPEFTPSTPAENPLLTPEFLPGCVDLYRKINLQIHEWIRDATSMHPGIKDRSMADIINTDWTAPLRAREPAPDFEAKGLSEEEKELHRERLERMQLIDQYADNSALDSVEPSADFLAYYISGLKEHLTSDPKYEKYVVALDRLIRLLKLHEQLEERFGYTEHDNELIGRLIAKLDTDANEGNKV